MITRLPLATLDADVVASVQARLVYESRKPADVDVVLVASMKEEVVLEFRRAFGAERGER